MGSNNKTREQRLNKGLCCECGRLPHLTGIQRCQSCKDRAKLNDAKRREKTKAQNVCSTKGCGNSIKNNIRCESCRKKQNNYVKKRRRSLKSKGLCESCGKNKATDNHLCETCWFKKLANKWLGDSSKWFLLQQKFESQNCSCPYTGIKLILGKNASIDHIKPRCKGGENEISNLQWVHIWINLMKFDLSHEEFIVKFECFMESCREKKIGQHTSQNR